jgi:norsolorinic acid ketoreductase
VTTPGIGFGLTASLLLRADTTVIATVRSSQTVTTELETLTTAANSKLIVATLSSNADDRASAMIDDLCRQGIVHIDTIIANAGSGEEFKPSLQTSIDSLRSHFEVNTLGPIKLFQAAYPLLQKSQNPKFIFISSSLGSIEAMEGNIPSLAYGMSKTAANYFVRKVHFEHEKVIALAVHPGYISFSNERRNQWAEG